MAAAAIASKRRQSMKSNDWETKGSVASTVARHSTQQSTRSSAVQKSTHSSHKQTFQTSGFFVHQEYVSSQYHSAPSQVSVAAIIAANFFCNILEKEIDPDGLDYSDVWGGFEVLFNVLFLIELLVNMYGHWWRTFWRDAWNRFDFLVVSVGILMMLPLSLPSAFGILRTLRVFRVFRLFNRVKSLKKIVVALGEAIPGVLNAFLILAIMFCIYAILGVEFFKDVGAGCEALTPDLTTARGNCLGKEYFGTFSKSLYSFFQVMTGDSWAEVIVRPVVWSAGDSIVTLGAAFYFVSFVLINAMVLVNVVVAVLLDKMVDPEVDVEGNSDDEDEVISESSDGVFVQAVACAKDGGSAESGAERTETGASASIPMQTIRSSREFAVEPDAKPELVVSGVTVPPAARSRGSLGSLPSSASTSTRGSQEAPWMTTQSCPALRSKQAIALDHASGNTLHARMTNIENQVKDYRDKTMEMQAGLLEMKQTIPLLIDAFVQPSSPEPDIIML